MTVVPPMEPASNENTARSSRHTQDGRKITYHLSVEQQPARARACGQGAKSSTDRRPVDPPPIVKLVMTEGENEGHDITFEHRTNFFLYATLEEARPVAQPRGIAPNSVVLTGTPVAGVSYLEKPSQGGYFVFSDLSVRYEGYYRLVFSLFEEVKRPLDLDPVESRSSAMPMNKMYCRCEVKSAPFKVFSAKKFPGLLESTEMSKLVSDQGCRVRIRRDIRMRRREPKDGKGDWGNMNDDDGAAALDVDEKDRKQEQNQMLADLNTNHHTRTFPEPTSATSVKSEAPVTPSYSNGPSTGLYHTPQQQQQQHVFVPQAASMSHPQSSPSSHQQQPQSAYSHQYDPANAPTYYDQVPPHAQPITFQHPRPPMHYNVQQPSSMYSMPQIPYAYAQQQQQQPPQPQPQPQQHPTPPHIVSKHAGFEPRDPHPMESLGHSRRESYQYQPQAHLDRRNMYLPLQYESQYSPMSQSSSAVQDQQALYRSSTSSSSASLPPFKALDSANPESPATASYQDQAPVYGQDAYDASQMPRPPTQYLSNANVSTVGKRAFGSVFNTQHIEEPLHSGARPDLNTTGDSSPTTDEEFDFANLNYRRADGRMSTINCHSMSNAFHR